jgi:beta-mannosidase
MNIQKSLNGKWKLKYFGFRQGKLQDALTEPCNQDNGWMDAVVPGDAHLDLMNAGILPDLYYGRNADHCRWMEEKDWWYRTSFSVPEEFSGRRICLLFRGLDTFASVYLNGNKIGSRDNMFVPLEIDITKKVRKDAVNELAVKLGSPAFSPLMEKHGEAYGKSFACVLTRRPQMSFGWDIGARLVTTGIWQDAELLGIDGGRLLDANIATLKLSGNSADMLLQAETEWFGKNGAEAKLELVIKDSKTCKFSFPAKLRKGRQQLNFKFSLESPKLWWPHDMGEPHLYEYELRLAAGKDFIDGSKSRFGVRTTELVLKEGKKNCFSLRINGRKVLIKGINWTPAGLIFAGPDEKRYRTLLDLTRDGNMNLIRVWGGGIYEHELFYGICDELGIMIWQDFMFACALYPYDGKFLSGVRNEAETTVKRLRRHPCLVLWCGDNENDWLNPLNYKVKNYGKNPITRKILPGACARFSPGVPYIPSTPHSPSGGYANSDKEGDTHLWYHGTSFRDKAYLENKSLLVSEIGHLSVPDRKTLLSFLPENKLWPPDSPIWFYHSTESNGIMKSRLLTLRKSITAYGAQFPDNIDDFIRLTQEIQAQACKTWIEHFCNLEGSGGIIIWSLCDSWPQVSDSIISHSLVPKPAYYSIKEAYGRLKK